MAELCLLAAMQAWLDMTPEGSKQTNEQVYAGEVPEVELNFSHLPTWLDELGRARTGGFGPVPLDYVEIESWARLAGVRLTHFESVALQKMSTVACGILADKDSKCPMAEEEDVQKSINDTNAQSWIALSRHEAFPVAS